MDRVKEILKFYQEIGVEFLEVQAESPVYSLKHLNRQILNCKKCELHKTKTNYVPGEGSAYPDIIFIGEGPGETEDQFGRPFIGKAGQLLNKIITRMGYSRETVFIGNVVKCRPPRNRDPLKGEVEACFPYLKEQIKILQPRVIVCLGKVAANHLLGGYNPISRIRGKIFYFDSIPMVATFHPSYILHQNSKEAISKAKWDTWSDMQKVLEILKKN